MDVRKHIRAIFSGAHGPEGMVGFRFRTKHANWMNGATYKELVREVKEAAPEVELLRCVFMIEGVADSDRTRVAA